MFENCFCYVIIQSKPKLFTVTEMMGKLQAKLGELKYLTHKSITYFKANKAKQALNSIFLVNKGEESFSWPNDPSIKMTAGNDL